MPATGTVTLQSLEELLDPDWEQRTFDEDVPEWLDQLHAVMSRIAEVTDEVAELGKRVELPAKVRDALGTLADAVGEVPPLARKAAEDCRELYESYEIPKLDQG